MCWRQQPYQRAQNSQRPPMGLQHVQHIKFTTIDPLCSHEYYATPKIINQDFYNFNFKKMRHNNLISIAMFIFKVLDVLKVK